MKALIVGGGLAGIIAAKAIKSNNPEAQITIIEKSKELGGLLKGKFYQEESLYFDFGTHIFQETGIAEIDNWLLKSVPSDELIHFDIGFGDISGSIFNGAVQQNSHFPDIRLLPDYKILHADITSHLKSSSFDTEIDRLKPVNDFGRRRFGVKYFSLVLKPILEQMYKANVEDLATFALLLPGLTRVIMDDLPEWTRDSENENYRNLISVPDQRKLPAKYRHRRRSFYSKSNGSRDFINGLEQRLSSEGVSIQTSSSISKIDLEKGILESEMLNGEIYSYDYDNIIFATGAIGASHLLGVDLAPFNFDRPLPHSIVNIQLQNSSESDLCYLYSLDNEFDFYRLTNYKAITGREDDKRITIEVLGKEKLEAGDVKLILSKLREIEFISTDHYDFVDIMNLGYGFPSPTVRNMHALSSLADHISKLLPSNAILGGVGSSSGLFFQNEIVVDMYNKVKSL